MNVLPYIIGVLALFFLIDLLVFFEHKLKQIYGEQYHKRLESFDVLTNKQCIRALAVTCIVGVGSIALAFVLHI